METHPPPRDWKREGGEMCKQNWLPWKFEGSQFAVRLM
jgi:hypothetical protein